MAEQKSFIIYYDTKNIIGALSDNQAGRLLKSLFRFAVSGESTDFSDDGMLRMAFGFMSEQIERDAAKYKAKCEKNRQIALERERKKRERKIINAYDSEPSCTNEHDSVPSYTNDHELVPSCTNVHERVSSCTNVQECAQSYTNVYDYEPPYTSEHERATSYTNVQEREQSYMNVYDYEPPYINEYEYEQPYIDEYDDEYDYEQSYMDSTDTDIETDTDDYRDNYIDRDKDRDKNKEKEKIYNNFSLLFSTATPYEIDCFIENFNNICKSFTPVSEISDTDRKNISKIVLNFTEEQIIETLNKIEKSWFLQGKKNNPESKYKDWKADFSWLIKYDRFLNILNGIYDSSSDDFDMDMYKIFINDLMST